MKGIRSGGEGRGEMVVLHDRTAFLGSITGGCCCPLRTPFAALVHSVDNPIALVMLVDEPLRRSAVAHRVSDNFRDGGAVFRVSALTLVRNEIRAPRGGTGGAATALNAAWGFRNLFAKSPSVLHSVPLLIVHDGVFRRGRRSVLHTGGRRPRRGGEGRFNRLENIVLAVVDGPQAWVSEGHVRIGGGPEARGFDLIPTVSVRV
mmetsp:Transcript_2253/g.4845  ORF Transcript_2253/g.4845 Transcript_2253/m.4845 type:complete len:204 (+) Transcript_2253:464-1075(+)